jgi:diaminopimelate decarboxylase
MSSALEAGVLMFNIESFQELEALDAVAAGLGKTAPISLRVNPDVDPKTHPYVATGLRMSKFGISFESAVEGYERARRLDHIEVVGIDCHIGSQLTEVGPFVDAVRRLRELIETLRARGFDIRYLDVGGGLGITYNVEEPPSPAEYGRAIRDELDVEDITLVLEPGRNLVGNAGILLSRVLYTKQTETKFFAIVDAGMNDLIRPSLYQAYHAIVPVLYEDRPVRKMDVVGPICESGDFLAQDRELPELAQGDLIAVMSAGAYGFSMASTYNSRPLAAEVLVDGSEAKLIHERGTYEDLLRGDRTP